MFQTSLLTIFTKRKLMFFQLLFDVNRKQLKTKESRRKINLNSIQSTQIKKNVLKYFFYFIKRIKIYYLMADTGQVLRFITTHLTTQIGLLHSYQPMKFILKLEEHTLSFFKTMTLLR